MKTAIRPDVSRHGETLSWDDAGPKICPISDGVMLNGRKAGKDPACSAAETSDPNGA
jgi:hypothetical protein